MRPHMLLAYDAAGNVVATLDHMVARDERGMVIGLIDFAEHEESGGELTDVWMVEAATGSKVWPEWLGVGAHDFRVELEGPPGRKRITALVHKTSGHRRERADIEAEIERRIAAAGDDPTDIRDLVGGPDRPLVLDVEGRTAPARQASPSNLPVIARQPEV